MSRKSSGGRGPTTEIQVRHKKAPVTKRKSEAPKGRLLLLARRLNRSDLGWFASARRRGLAAGRQRGINLQAALVKRLLKPNEWEAGQAEVLCRRSSTGEKPEMRTIARPSRNWLLRGRQVEDDDLEEILPGDWLLLDFGRDDGRLTLVWEPVLLKRDPASHEVLENTLSALVEDGVAVLEETTIPLLAREIACLRGLLGLPSPKDAPRKVRSVTERLRDPHILTELMRHGAVLTAEAQKDFLQQLQALSEDLREILLEARCIRCLAIDHKKTWDSVRGRPLTFVDGGVASIQALGAEPLAIRVGSYTVRPGVEGDERETFQFLKTLVDELFESGLEGSSGVYEEPFEDVAKLRDAARISLETAAVLELLRQPERPVMVFVHGPLVNPVSPYGLQGFPNFRPACHQALLPGLKQPRTGRDANFISIHLEQLEQIVASGVPTTGVVERASISRVVGEAILEDLVREDYADASTVRRIQKRIAEYRLTDSLLFEVILDPGEYLRPLRINKNTANKIPNEWRDVIESYPHPLVTYLKPSATSLPVRVELLPNDMPEPQLEHVLALVLHMSRLLPRYAFPVGLDIVDKYAKVPAWMSRGMGQVFAAQVMRRAMESGNPQVISMARRYLSGNSRDWFFRPTL